MADSPWADTLSSWGERGLEDTIDVAKPTLAKGASGLADGARSNQSHRMGPVVRIRAAIAEAVEHIAGTEPDPFQSVMIAMIIYVCLDGAWAVASVASS